MVARVGVEPTTYRVWTDCSSQLSYLANSLRNKMVGMAGFEPVTSWSQIKHSTKLSYIPIRIGCFGTASKMLWRRSCLAMGAHRIIIMSGGDGGSWTHTVFLPRDFKSLASTIPPHPHFWRFLPDSNRWSQSCSLLPYHLAKEPSHVVPYYSNNKVWKMQHLEINCFYLIYNLL